MDSQSRVREEFARQADSLSVAPAFTDAEVLEKIRAATGPTKTMRILDLGCGSPRHQPGKCSGISRSGFASPTRRNGPSPFLPSCSHWPKRDSTPESTCGSTGRRSSLSTDGYWLRPRRIGKRRFNNDEVVKIQQKDGFDVGASCGRPCPGERTSPLSRVSRDKARKNEE